MDEMELRINQKGITWSWFFLVLSLFVWGAYNFAKTQEMTLPMVLFTLQFLVYFFVTSVARSNVDDAGGKKQALVAFGVMGLVIVFGVVLYFTIGH